MNEKTLQDVYFQLGETTKFSEESIGGHGRARILTCFAHENYRILTQNLEVQGKGGLYEIIHTPLYHKGCTVEVIISQSDKENIDYALESYLETCQLPYQVIVNNSPFQNWMHRRIATRTLSFGTLHTTQKRGYCIISRVKGVTMFSNYIDCETGIILEIDPAKAREILPISRDSLKYEPNQELHELAAEIAIDHKSIKRDCLTTKTEVFGNLKSIKAAKPQNPTPEKNPVCLTTGNNETIYHRTHHFQNAAFHNPHFSQNIQDIPPTEEDLPNFAIHFEDTPKNMIQWAKRFDRTTISGTRLKMLRAWEAAIEFCLSHMLEDIEEGTSYLPGFVFAQEALGMNVPQPNNGFLILIRPITPQGKLEWSIHHYEKIFSIAVHECCHILCRAHNEKFATLLTHYTQKILENFSEFKITIKTAIASPQMENSTKKEALESQKKENSSENMPF